MACWHCYHSFTHAVVSAVHIGGKYFDPIGFSRGDEAMYKKYKQNEIVNGRLAMVANLGFWAQYAATGKGPIQNLADHLADPYHTTFTTNGVSVPFFR